MVDRPFTTHIAQTYPEWSEILQEQPPMTTRGRPHIWPWHKLQQEGDTEREHCVDEAALKRARSSAYGFARLNGFRVKVRTLRYQDARGVEVERIS